MDTVTDHRRRAPNATVEAEQMANKQTHTQYIQTFHVRSLLSGG